MITHNRRRRRFLIILVVCFLLAVNITLGFILTTQSSAAITSLIQGRMLDASNTAASMIDGDTLSRLTSDDADTAAYQEIYDTLEHFQDHTGLKYVYCLRATDDGRFVYTIDPAKENPASFGDEAVSTDARLRASQGAPSVDEHSYHDDWGTFYSSYSPVLTSAGDVAGIVAVDFDAAWYDLQIMRLVLTVVAVAAMSLGAGVLLVLSLARKEVVRYHMLYGQLNTLADKVEELVSEIDGDEAQAHPLPEAPARRRRLLPTRDVDEIDALGEKVLTMQDDIRTHIERIKAQAYLDGLTGLGNKAAHLEAVKRLDDEVLAGNAHFAVAVFDLNGLKEINDTYGHECGDLALSDAADRLRQVFGDKALFRVGGDEFIAVVDPSNDDDMDRLMRELDVLLAAANETERPYVLPLALSKGAAVFAPEKDDGYQAVFRRADMMMYHDKAAYYAHGGDRRRR